MSNQDSYGVGHTQIVLGLSTVTEIKFSKSNGLFINKLAGGSLCIAGVSGAIGSGFLYQEPMTFSDFRGPLYFTAVGATVTVDILAEYTTNPSLS